MQTSTGPVIHIETIALSYTPAELRHDNGVALDALMDAVAALDVLLCTVACDLAETQTEIGHDLANVITAGSGDVYRAMQAAVRRARWQIA